jgi:hypothetical protein
MISQEFMAHPCLAKQGEQNRALLGVVSRPINGRAIRGWKR